MTNKNKWVTYKQGAREIHKNKNSLNYIGQGSIILHKDTGSMSVHFYAPRDITIKEGEKLYLAGMPFTISHKFKKHNGSYGSYKVPILKHINMGKNKKVEDFEKGEL